MIKNIIDFIKKENTAKATAILIFASVGSNVLGMIRNHFFTKNITTTDLATYYAAFRIPDLIFNLLVLGAISAAFIPIFVGFISSKDKEKAWQVTNYMVNIALLFVSLAAVILAIFMPQLTQLIAPGFDAAAKNMTTQLARIMLLSPLFFSLSSIAGGILVSFRKFWAYAFAPCFYNLGIIFGTIYLVPRFGMYGLAYGVLIGAFLHFIIQLPQVFRLGFRYRPVIDFKDKAIKEIGRLMLPRIGGLAANQANLIILTVFGSLLGGGSIAYLNLSNDIQTFVSVVFGISFATAVFPLLAEHAHLQKSKDFIRTFSDTFRKILFLTIPASVGLILLRGQIVRLILGYGHFNFVDTKLTAAVLGAFCVSIFAQGTIPLLSRAFYSLKDTKTPFIAAGVAVLINLVGSIFLPRVFAQISAYPGQPETFAVVGLAAAFSIASFINMIWLLVILHHRLGYLDDLVVLKSLIKILFASFFMSLVIQGTKYLIAPLIDPSHPVSGFLTQVSIAIPVGMIAYFGIMWVLRAKEMNAIKELAQIRSK